MHDSELSSAQDVEQVIQQLSISRQEFAHALGLQAESIAEGECLRSQCIQRRLKHCRTILERVEPWEGSTSAAWSWYRSQPIPALGGLAASEIVSSDRGDEVLAYLEAVAEGGYA